MGVLIALAAAASAAATGPPECATASATKYCCAADACVAPHHGSAHHCGAKTDCSAHCGAALTAHQQRTCADGQFARLIGHECHACPEDATTATANTPAAVATTAPEMGVELVANADQTTHASTAEQMSGGTEPQTPPSETSVTRSTLKQQTATIASLQPLDVVDFDDLCPTGYKRTAIGNENFCMDIFGADWQFEVDANTEPILQNICAPASSDRTCCTVNYAAGSEGFGVPSCVKATDCASGKDGTNWRADCAQFYFLQVASFAHCGQTNMMYGVEIDENSLVGTITVSACEHHYFNPLRNIDVCSPATPATPCCQIIEGTTLGDGGTVQCRSLEGDGNCPVNIFSKEDAVITLCTEISWDRQKIHNCPLGYAAFNFNEIISERYGSVCATIPEGGNAQVELLQAPSAFYECAASSDTSPACCKDQNLDVFFCTAAEDSDCEVKDQPLCPYLHRYRISNVDTIDNQWRVAIVKGFADTACTLEVTEGIAIETLSSEVGHSAGDMAGGDCNTFWETPEADGPLASEEASIYVRSTTELKCFQVAHPPGSESQYTTTHFNVHDLTAATTLGDFYAGGNTPKYENVDVDDSLCTETPIDDPADDNDGETDDPYQPTDDPADDNEGGESDGGLTGGEIGGIVGASVGGVVIVGAIVYYVRTKKGEGPKFTMLINTQA